MFFCEVDSSPYLCKLVKIVWAWGLGVGYIPRMEWARISMYSTQTTPKENGDYDGEGLWHFEFYKNLNGPTKTNRMSSCVHVYHTSPLPGKWEPQNLYTKKPSFFAGFLENPGEIYAVFIRIIYD